MTIFATQTECELGNYQQFGPKSPHIHVMLFQQAAVAGCCHACSCKQRLVCCQSGLLLKAQILLVFHNVQPLCVCVYVHRPVYCALIFLPLIVPNVCCVGGSRNPIRENSRITRGNCTRVYLWETAVLFLETDSLSVLPSNWEALPSFMHLNPTQQKKKERRISYIHIYLPRSLFLPYIHTHSLSPSVWLLQLHACLCVYFWKLTTWPTCALLLLVQHHPTWPIGAVHRPPLPIPPKTT